MPVKNVQIETTTRCNQRCTFCPVSLERRPKQLMDRGTLEKILDSLAVFPVETIYLNGFNEPTLDTHLMEWVAMIHARGYKIHLNSNGAWLTPELSDQLLAAGVATININLSTVDDQRYRETRGNNDLKRVLPNIDYLLAASVGSGTKVTLMVLGELDEQHRHDIEAIEARFKDHASAIVVCPTDNFAGSSDDYFPKDIQVRKLSGCAGNRATEWLHFTPDGAAILCCQDYHSRYVVGHIADASAEAIYWGDSLALLRRQIGGEEEAPADFICRHCVMAVDMRDRFCRGCQLVGQMGRAAACDRCAVGGE